MSFIEYHNSATWDTFTTTETTNREDTYYGGSGHPTVYSDGLIKRIGGGSGNYAQYRSDFNARKAIASPLLIRIYGNYNTGTRQGTVNACIKNTTGTSVTGTLQFVIVETHIPYAWQTEDTLFFVARDMLPNQNGEVVTIPAADSITKSRNFTMNTSWVEGNCQIIAFVQGSTKEVYQCAKKAISSFGIEESIADFGMRNAELTASPNPFIKSLELRVESKELKENKIQIYDISGKLVKIFQSITDNSSASGGTTNVTWDGKDNTGIPAKAGIYFVHLSTNDYSISRKIVKTR
ncbi:MAG: Omp28-related outer membrane protein [bacterium]|nr:Omp28-related outer membrane protein [bacterium]